MIFCTLTYNNYFNRIIKRETSYADYSPFLFNTTMNVNFNEGDGINAQFVLTSMQDQRLFNDAAVKPDYAVYMDDYYNIVSRWFIVESHKERGGQYVLSLKRDVVADNWESLINNADCLVERASLDLNANDPAVYKEEGFSFNQIKRDQRLIFDKFGSSKGWIVGYVAKGTKPPESYNNKIPVDYTATAPDYTMASFREKFGKYFLTNPLQSVIYDLSSSRNENIKVITNIDTAPGTASFPFTIDFNGSKNVGDSGDPTNGLKMTLPVATARLYVYETVDHAKLTAMSASFGYPFIDGPSITELAGAAGSLVYDEANKKYYTVVLNPHTNRGTFTYTKTSMGSSNYEKIANVVMPDIQNHPSAFTGTYNDSTFQMQLVNPRMLTISLVEQESTANIEWTDGYQECLNTPYDVFCMPLEGTVTVSDGASGSVSFTTNPTLGTNTAIALSKALSSAQLYDIQLLPYSPLQDTELTALTASHTQPKASMLVKDTNETVIGALMWISSADKYFRSDFVITNDSTKEDGINNFKYKKVSNECDMFRISSPNGSSVYDFSAAKNGGLTGFNISMTCKPYQPYIRVCPLFNGLYGSNFQDYRGLILGGEYSLPIVNDAWTNYQLNNKNYQDIFDRETKTLENQRSIEKIQQKVGVVTGAIGAGLSGAKSGALVGGGYGAVIGAGIGAAASIGGGIADVYLSQQLYENNMRARSDIFNLNLGSVQARPLSLTRTSAFTVDTLKLPLVEYYTCTDTERETFEDYLRLYGCVIGRVGKLKDYINLAQTEQRKYLQGRIIRLEGLYCDSHTFNELNNELQGGVYI